MSAKLPWASTQDALQIVANILSAAPVPALEAPGLSPDIARIVAGTLSKAREQRFTDMHSVSLALQRAGVGVARPDTVDPIAPTAALTSPIAASAANPPRGSHRLVWLGLLTLALGLTALIWRVVTQSTEDMATESSPTASAVASTSTSALSADQGPVLTLVNQPRPSTTNTKALELWNRARVLQHEANWIEAEKLLLEAVELDPHFGEAYFQLAAIQLTFGGPIERQRDLYRRAVNEQRRLSERNRELVRAFEPTFARDPIDPRRTIQNLQELVQRWPQDVEILYWHALLSGRLELQLHEAPWKRIVEMDPEAVDAWQVLIELHALAGRFDEALAGIERVHRLAPNSRDAAATAAFVYDHLGRCEDVEREGRRLGGATLLAVMLPFVQLRMGRSRETVLESAERFWKETPLPRHYIEPLDRAQLATYDGDFVLAQRLAKAAIEVAKKESLDLIRPASQLTFNAYEAGALKNEGHEVLDLYRRRAELGTRPATVFDADGWLIILAMLREVGLITDAELTQAKAGYAKLVERDLAAKPTLAWALTEAQTVRTKEEAIAALKKAPTPLDQNELYLLPYSKVAVGQTLLLGDRPGEALQWLRAVERLCSGWILVGNFGEVHKLIGEALEATRDTKGACEAYAEVLERWGKAKKSRTADFARERRRALSCSATPPGL